MGLLKFFMVGVVDNNLRGRMCSDSGVELGLLFVNMDIVRKSLLLQNLWKLYESVLEIVIEGSLIREEKEQLDIIIDKEFVIFLLFELELLVKNYDRLDFRLFMVVELVLSDLYY